MSIIENTCNCRKNCWLTAGTNYLEIDLISNPRVFLNSSPTFAPQILTFPYSPLIIFLRDKGYEKRIERVVEGLTLFHETYCFIPQFLSIR